MEITKNKLGHFAGNLLSFLKKEKINSIEDLTQRNMERFSMDGQDRIIIELRPSELSSVANTISYMIPGVGIPIEARINSILDYSRIIIKSQEDFQGYSTFAGVKDIFKNIIQEKTIREASLDVVKKELEELKTYVGY